MQITLLGTGDAAGWPHPFCNCASCAAALAESEIRSHTAALIDDVLLVDCGQDVPRSAVRLGVRLDHVRYLLVTHDHYDHADGAALLMRRWAGGGPLTVVGPASALARLSPWLPPDDAQVEFRPVAASDELTLDGYTVRVLAADHDSDGAVIYDVASSTHRLLYATDTGPDFATPAGAHYDLLLLEDSWGDWPVAVLQATTDSGRSPRPLHGCGASMRSTTRVASWRSTSGTEIRRPHSFVRDLLRWAASSCRTAR
jgi:adenosylcobinamide kinase/adenosylcobinamide-phosphate guanylyltransferase